MQTATPSTKPTEKPIEVNSFFDRATCTVSHIAADPASGRCAVIDPVLDFDSASGRTATVSADALIDHIHKRGLSVDWLLETHVHADHLSAAPYLRERLGGRLAIGAQVTDSQRYFGALFNTDAEFATDGSQFDHLFGDGERFQVGGIDATALFTPGHTPGCMSYLIGDALFVGDTLFMPDYGTARCDFPGGDARTLYRSVRRLLSLPDDTRMFLCHDYKAPGRDEYVWQTTVGEQRRHNVHVREGVSEEAFVKMRTERDAGLTMPRLILPSVQVNIRAGALPPPEDNGTRYLKIPLNMI